MRLVQMAEGALARKTVEWRSNLPQRPGAPPWESRRPACSGRPVKIVDRAPARLRGRGADQGISWSVESAGVAADLAMGGAPVIVEDEERGAPVGGAIEPGRCDDSTAHSAHRAGAMRHGIRGGAGEHVG